MPLFKTLLALIAIILLTMFLIYGIDEIKYSYKHETEGKTCYFDRGIFNLPFIHICSEPDAVIIEKDAG